MTATVTPLRPRITNQAALLARIRAVATANHLGGSGVYFADDGHITRPACDRAALIEYANLHPESDVYATAERVDVVVRMGLRAVVFTSGGVR